MVDYAVHYRYCKDLDTEENSMRVIAGKAKRIPLVAPSGLDTRPTQDRTKETLFNMLQPYIADCLFLDLFSGSGAIGIEALSRGAKEAVFVEQGKDASDCIKNNLKKTKLESDATLLKMNVFDALNRLEQSQKCFDCIFHVACPSFLLFSKTFLLYENTYIIERTRYYVNLFFRLLVIPNPKYFKGIISLLFN